LREALTASQTTLSWEVEIYLHCRAIGTAGSLFGTGKFVANNAVLATSVQPVMIPASAAVAVGSLDLTGTSLPSLQASRSGSTAEHIWVQDYDISPMT
jgi:hypothetical protein